MRRVITSGAKLSVKPFFGKATSNHAVYLSAGKCLNLSTRFNNVFSISTNYRRYTTEVKKVPVELLKKLRKMTEAPLGKCRQALEEADGDLEKAQEILRKMGAITAEKKSSRAAAEGFVAIKVAPDASYGVAVEMNSETDFVARNDHFRAILSEIRDQVFETKITNIEELKQIKLNSTGVDVQTSITDLIGKVNENVQLRRAGIVKAVEGGSVISYVHNSFEDDLGAIGTLVAIKPLKDGVNVNSIGRDVAMHITGMSPIALTRDQIPSEVLEKEKERLREEAIKEGKPEAELEKIIEGKLNKFYEKMALYEQSWALDPEKRVDEYLQEVGVQVTDFLRFKCGEE